MLILYIPINWGEEVCLPLLAFPSHPPLPGEAVNVKTAISVMLGNAADARKGKERPARLWAPCRVHKTPGSGKDPQEGRDPRADTLREKIGGRALWNTHQEGPGRLIGDSVRTAGKQLAWMP